VEENIMGVYMGMERRFYNILEEVPLGTLGQGTRDKKTVQMLALRDDGRKFRVETTRLHRENVLLDYEEVGESHYFTFKTGFSSTVPPGVEKGSTSFIRIQTATKGAYSAEQWDNVDMK
jgi:hypothetical protein